MFPPRTILDVVARLRGRRIVVVGDLIADEYLYGKPARISREAPVLILRFTDREVRLGGGANAAHNVRALGAHAVPVGVVGDDGAGARRSRRASWPAATSPPDSRWYGSTASPSRSSPPTWRSACSNGWPGSRGKPTDSCCPTMAMASCPHASSRWYVSSRGRAAPRCRWTAATISSASAAPPRPRPTSRRWRRSPGPSSAMSGPSRRRAARCWSGSRPACSSSRAAVAAWRCSSATGR